MPVKLAFVKDAPLLHVRVPLGDSRSEAELGAALKALVAATKDLEKVVKRRKEPPPFLRITFHTPARKWLSERRFFERTSKVPALTAATLAFVAQVDPKRWRSDPFHGAGYWTTNATPAGSLAIVPLALRKPLAPGVLAGLADHLRGADLDHETFHRGLVTAVVQRHGLVDAVLDLLAVRAVDAAGQHGPDDLQWLAANTELGARVRAPGGVTAFAQRVDKLNERSKYRALYVANAGRALFGGDAARYAEWIAFFRKKKVTFDAAMLAPPAARTPHPPKDFDAEWEEAASSEDVD